ncbi:MAG: tetratricopeptide repeat protein [Bacteroidales bacterium]
MDFKPGIADYHFLKGAIFNITGHIDSAIFHDNRSLELAEEFHDLNRKAGYFRAHAMLLRATGKSPMAMEYYKKSLEMYRQTGNMKRVAVLYNSLGTYQLDMANYDSAMVLFLEAIKIYEEENIQYRKHIVFINLGKVYFNLKDYEKAMQYFEQGLALSLEYNVLSSAALCYSSIGMVYQRLEDYKKAREYYELSKGKYSSFGDKTGFANAISNIATLLDLEGSYLQAMEEFKKARAIFIDISDIGNEELALSNIALIHERLGNYNLALNIYDTCLQINYRYNRRERILHTYNNIYKTHELAGNFEQAYYYSTRYISLKDSIFSLEKEELIGELELKYEKEKDQAHILQLQNENLQKSIDLRTRTHQRNVFFILATAIIVIALIIFIFFKSKTRKDKIISEQKIAKLEQEKKLLAARALVEGQEVERRRIASDLHDGIGVLLTTVKMQFSNIREKSKENEEELKKAEDLLNQASGDVRKISHNMMPSILTKLGLEEALEDLFEKVNESKELAARISILNEDAASLTENSEIMIYRIVQELVNNTIKHAEASIISLNVVFDKEKITLQYSDNGKGFDFKEKLESGTVGLSSLQTRVEFLGGELNFDTEPGKGYLCYIQIPLKRD